MVEVRAELPDGATKKATPELARGSVLSGLTVALNVLSLCVAVILVLILFSTWKSVQHLNALESRLAELAPFEERQNRRLDVVNQGIHSQFDELNRRIASVVTELDSTRSRLETALIELRALERQREAAVRGMPQASSDASGGREVTISAPSTPSSQSNPSVAEQPVASPAFRRVVTPDGKVTYSLAP